MRLMNPEMRRLKVQARFLSARKTAKIKSPQSRAVRVKSCPRKHQYPKNPISSQRRKKKSEANPIPKMWFLHQNLTLLGHPRKRKNGKISKSKSEKRLLMNSWKLERKSFKRINSRPNLSNQKMRFHLRCLQTRIKTRIINNHLNQSHLTLKTSRLNSGFWKMWSMNPYFLI